MAANLYYFQDFTSFFLKKDDSLFYVTCTDFNFSLSLDSQGDGGGPLVCSKSGSYQLVGVTSWGSSTCDPAYPTIFTRIYNYLDWIKEKTGI